MNRLKLLLIGAVSSILFFAAFPSFAQDGGVTALWSPTFENFKPQDSFYICQGSTIYDTVKVTNYEPDQIITITKLSGPGNFNSTPSVSPAYGYYSYTPTSEGSFQVVYEAHNSGGRKAQATKTYYIFFNHPPQITTGDTSFYDCFPSQTYTYSVHATDFENDPLTFSILSGEGTIDPITGLITYSADSSGRFCFQVEAADSCGSDTAQICIEVALNTLPSLSGFSQKAVLCAPDSICFTIGGYDPDAGDSLVITKIQGPGKFETIESDTGKTCFLPDNVDSADYIFIYEATDRCLRGELGSLPLNPPHIIDTVIYTVIISPAPALSCPKDTNLFICHPDTICFPIGNISSIATVHVSPPSAWFDYQTNSVCFYTNCSVVRHIKLVASSSCGTDSCQFTVNVSMNSAPLVILAPDTSVKFCTPQEVCIPAGISDIDNNIIDISVSDGGHYNFITGTICFAPDRTGDYNLILTATDVCGSIGRDSVLIHASINERPTITSGGNFSIPLCSLKSVCVPVSVDDANMNLKSITVSPYGTYNVQAKTLCFTPTHFGLHRITITALDSCGASASDSININILQNIPPVVQSGPDSTVYQCALSTVCYPITISDADNGIASIVVNNGGSYSNNQVCFMPTHAGEYKMITAATDSCGAFDMDTTIINVILNASPVIHSADNFSIEQCELSEICFRVDKISGNIKDITANRGQYDPQTGNLCYLPESFGIDTIVITAIDSCGATAIDTTIVSIGQGASAQIACPTVANINLCEPDTICVPLSISPSSATVTASAGHYSNGQLCFYAANSGEYDIQVIASAPCGSDTCTVSVNVAIGQPPSITCPGQPVNSFLCQAGQVCVDLPISGYQNVVVNGASWADGKLCFTTGISGRYDFTVIASNECGADTCQLAVVVEIGKIPNITCPVVPTDTFLCTPGLLCINIPIADYDSVIVDSGSWSNGRFCFNADSTGNHNFTIIAMNKCGADTCDFTINVTLGKLPHISCPPAPIDTFICTPGEMCIDIPIIDYQSVTVEGASWSNGKLCFMADKTGRLDFTIIASSGCGADTCHVTVNVIVGDLPVISCPPVPIQLTACRGTDSVCIDLPIAGADSVHCIWGTWQNGVLCFWPNDIKHGDSITATVIASNKCGADTCMVTAFIHLIDPPVINCPPGGNFNACVGDTICIPLYVSPGSQVVVINGIFNPPGKSWDTGKLCVVAYETGTITATIIATNNCGADTCNVAFNITIGVKPQLSCPAETTITLCAAQMVCRPIGVSPADANITILPAGIYENGNACFMADTAGIYSLKIRAETACGVDSCNFRVNVKFDQPPIIISKDTAIFACSLGNNISVGIKASDLENDPIAFKSLTPSGHIDSVSGLLNFTADSVGQHCFNIVASDWCGADTSFICVNVTVNAPPVVVSGNDTTITECTNKPICINVNITDKDNNIDSIYAAPGLYSNGKVCFTPPQVGVYYVVTTAVDHCGARAADTTIVTAETTQPISLVCPRDTAIFLCTAGNVCLPISGIPHGAIIHVSPPSAWLNSDSTGICFYTNCSVAKNLKIVAENVCGKDSCTFRATVTMNSKPLAILAPDTTIAMCDLREICIPAGVSDLDNNIVNISVTPSGSYNPITGRVCFMPSGAGAYTIILRATDACGAIGSDSVRVTVNLNRPPVVNSDPDFAVSQCRPTQICFGVAVSDPDNEIPSVVVSQLGVYNPITKKVCFTPPGAGSYKLIITATDHCGLKAKDSTIINVTTGPTAQVTCSPDTSVLLCAPDTVSRRVTIFPETAQVIVSPAGVYRNGKVYFKIDTSGIYIVTVIARAECGDDTCSFRVNAQINAAPVVNAGSDTTYFLCNLTQICRQVSVTDPNNNIRSISVTPTGSYDPITGGICFTPPSAGTYCLKIIAEDYCGLSDTDEVCITITMGALVDIQCPTSPFTQHICNPGQVCVPLVVTPPGAQVTLSYGTFSNNQVCFRADTAGIYRIRAIATASCGADTCNFSVNVIFDPVAVITCPDSPTSVSLCGPDSVKILLPINPANATVTVSPNGNYNSSTHMVSFYVATSGTHSRTIIASATCGADTCIVTANVTIGQAAQVTCPGNIDTTVCVSSISQLCFPVTVTPTGATVRVLPSGSYSAGRVCIPISGAATYPVSVIASTVCGADTCNLNIEVNDNTAPILTVPANAVLPVCDDSIGEICIDGIFATDINNDNLIITKTCGPGNYYSIGPDSGKVCFTPTNIDTTYSFCMQASDGCRTISKSFSVTVYPSPECLVCTDLSIQTDSCVVVGAAVPIRLVVSTRDPVGGFDLLVSYDASVMSLLNTKQGDAIGGWEYFTFRVGTVGDCGSCPSGLIRIVGIADINNGPHHPPSDQYNPNGILATINMRVSSDQNLGGQFLPIGFFWFDCGDNAFADQSGINLYIDSRIYNSSGSIIWDESNDGLFPETNRPFGLGAPDTCMVGNKVAPSRCVGFHFGGICVIHPDSIDARGDINLNGVRNEIGDAVVFTNYFLYGLAAFVISVDGQTAASDVNSDGHVLTVADLVYLIRIITGDAEPIPKISPDMANVDLSTMTDNNMLALDIDHRSPIGGGFLTFKYEGVKPLGIEGGESAGEMTIQSVITDSEIRVLFYSFERGAMIDAGKGELVRIRYEGNGSVELTEASFASYNGVALTSRLGSNSVPSQFGLSQNYPNPFNPRTTIELSLPIPSEWRLTIINVNGQVVRKLSGYSEAGTTAIEWDGYNDSGQPATSGIYFYKAEAESFSATRKMILLK